MLAETEGSRTIRDCLRLAFICHDVPGPQRTRCVVSKQGFGTHHSDILPRLLQARNHARYQPSASDWNNNHIQLPIEGSDLLAQAAISFNHKWVVIRTR